MSHDLRTSTKVKDVTSTGTQIKVGEPERGGDMEIWSSRARERKSPIIGRSVGSGVSGRLSAWMSYDTAGRKRDKTSGRAGDKVTPWRPTDSLLFLFLFIIRYSADKARTWFHAFLPRPTPTLICTEYSKKNRFQHLNFKKQLLMYGPKALRFSGKILTKTVF